MLVALPGEPLAILYSDVNFHLNEEKFTNVSYDLLALEETVLSFIYRHLFDSYLIYIFFIVEASDSDRHINIVKNCEQF